MKRSAKITIKLCDEICIFLLLIPQETFTEKDPVLLVYCNLSVLKLQKLFILFTCSTVVSHNK